MTYSRVLVDEEKNLTKRGPSTLIKGTRGKTTDPSGMAKTSMLEQSTDFR